MKKKLLTILLVVCMILPLASCFMKNGSYFKIQFIDVGQGDCALVECDGRYMLIDGGPSTAKTTVRNILMERRIHTIDYLVISHFHKDHIGGLEEALKSDYLHYVGTALVNSTNFLYNSFPSLEPTLKNLHANIQVPSTGEEFTLGSATVEVLHAPKDKNPSNENDCLVLMVTYKKTRFIFTGDIENELQSEIANSYTSLNKNTDYETLMKVPHHGAGERKSSGDTKLNYSFVNSFLPKNKAMYFVISVGKNNRYDHPCKDTIDMLKQTDGEIWRTDTKGNIFVQSNGIKISVKSERNDPDDEGGNCCQLP